MRKRRDVGQPSDIAFLLIIFFVLMAGVTISHGFTSDLLSTSVHAPSTSANVQLVLMENGTIVHDGRVVQGDGLSSLLTPESMIHVLIEGKTPWQLVVDLFARIERHSVSSLSLELLE